jgi:hypothetical protein
MLLTCVEINCLCSFVNVKMWPIKAPHVILLTSKMLEIEYSFKPKKLPAVLSAIRTALNHERETIGKNRACSLCMNMVVTHTIDCWWSNETLLIPLISLGPTVELIGRGKGTFLAVYLASALASTLSILQHLIANVKCFAS